MKSRTGVSFSLILNALSILVIIWLGEKYIALSKKTQFCPTVPFLFETEVDGIKYRGDSTKLLDAMLLVSGGHEADVTVLSEFAKPLDFENKIFIDVGAHKGLYTTRLAHYFKQVFAFEPNPAVLRGLRKNIEINNLQNINVFPFGLGKRNDTLTFFVPAEWHDGTGTFSPSMWEEHGGKKMQIAVKRGDEVLKEHQPQASIGAIKVDVEGFEKPVLQGFEQMLAKNRPLVLLELNMNNAEGFSTHSELQKTLPKDYMIYEIKNNDHHIKLQDLDRSSRVQRNIIAIPRSTLGQVKETRFFATG